MAKLTLNNVGDLTNPTTAANNINANSILIQTAVENTLSLDGTSPNQMQSDFDMNSHQIINLPAPSTANSALRLQDLEDFIVTGGSSLLQPRSDILTSITGNGTNPGYLTVIGDGTVSSRTFTASGGLSVANGNGVSGPTVYSIDAPTARTTLSINNVDNTSDAIKNAAVATLTNKTLTSPVMTAPALGTPVSGVATNLTGTAAGLTSGNVTTNANLTGDVTSVGNATTLASVLASPGTYGNSTQVPQINILGKGLINAAGNVTLTPAVGSITGLGTGVGPFLATPTSANLKTAVATSNTGSGALVFATSPTLVTPALGVATATSINGSTVSPGHYSGEPSTGSAVTGEIGEYVESVIPIGSAVSLTTNTAKDMTTISLTAGDWDVDAMFGITGGSTTIFVNEMGCISSGATNTMDFTNGRFAGEASGGSAYVSNSAVGGKTLNVAPVRFSLSTTTTIRAIAYFQFNTSTAAVYGILRARRIR